MKFRTDFVTNSSSSGFVIVKIEEKEFEDFLERNELEGFFDEIFSMSEGASSNEINTSVSSSLIKLLLGECLGYLNASDCSRNFDKLIETYNETNNFNKFVDMYNSVTKRIPDEDKDYWLGNVDDALAIVKYINYNREDIDKNSKAEITASMVDSESYYPNFDYVSLKVDHGVGEYVSLNSNDNDYGDDRNPSALYKWAKKHGWCKPDGSGYVDDLYFDPPLEEIAEDYEDATRIQIYSNKSNAGNKTLKKTSNFGDNKIKKKPRHATSSNPVSHLSSKWRKNLDIKYPKIEEINIVNSYEKTGKEEYEFIDEKNNLTFYRTGNVVTIVTLKDGAVVSKYAKKLFSSGQKLKKITGLELLDTSNVADMEGMFFNSCKLESLDLSSFNTSNVTDMREMFSGCKNLKSLDLSSFNTSNVTDMTWMFRGCENLESLDLSSFDTSKVTSMSSMFWDCKRLESLDLSSFDTSKVRYMSSMFHYCYHLKPLNLSSFNTSNVTDMRWMFYGCDRLESLDLSSFDTSKITDMSYMFSDCENLKSLDLSSFDTSKVTDMSGMFSSCKNLKSLDLSSFDTSKVTDMSSMFYGCKSLESLDLSSFNTLKVTNMRWMFDGCKYKEKFEKSLKYNSLKTIFKYLIHN